MHFTERASIARMQDSITYQSKPDYAWSAKQQELDLICALASSKFCVLFIKSFCPTQSTGKMPLFVHTYYGNKLWMIRLPKWLSAFFADGGRTACIKTEVATSEHDRVNPPVLREWLLCAYAGRKGLNKLDSHRCKQLQRNESAFFWYSASYLPWSLYRVPAQD